MKIYALYFSPTGGTKKVLDILISAWDCEKEYIDLSDRNNAWGVCRLCYFLSTNRCICTWW